MAKSTPPKKAAVAKPKKEKPPVAPKKAAVAKRKKEKPPIPPKQDLILGIDGKNDGANKY